jgi:integrase
VRDLLDAFRLQAAGPVTDKALKVLGLAWERVDFARDVLRLEQTKSGRRREIPMNQAVDQALSSRRSSGATRPLTSIPVTYR